jgi:DNA replication protein DnaC
MSSGVRDAVLQQYCRELKLPAVLREYPALARQARDSGMAYEDFLRELLEAEIRSRNDSATARRLREARFPEVKTLDHVDWQALQGVSRPKVLELASCEFITKAEDVVLAGPIGTGKTLLAIGLGVEAARRRHRVAFTRAADLVRDLREARDERTLGQLHRRLQRVGLLIVDELGFVPFDQAGGELLFNLLADRYERRSTIVTTNLAFAEWVQVFGSEKLTTALLDRLGHHAHVLTTRGTSYRTRGRRHERERATESPDRAEGPTSQGRSGSSASTKEVPPEKK